jgi:hypothetical protein
MKPDLIIVIAHILPGRLRIRFSHPILKESDLTGIIKKHPGISSAAYTSITQNLVVTYDQEEITTEEIILRASLAFSKDYDLCPVQIQSAERSVALGNLSLYSGFSLIVSHVFNLIFAKSQKLATLNTISAVTTLAAVLDHVYQDLKQKRQFHPEVFSLYYLVLSLMRGNMLKGTTITWFLTFARHMIEMPADSLVVKTVPSDSTCRKQHCEYEVTVSKKALKGTIGNLMQIIPQLVLNIYRDRNSTFEDSLLKQIMTVAESHDEMIEGLENLKEGILLKVES